MKNKLMMIVGMVMTLIHADKGAVNVIAAEKQKLDELRKDPNFKEMNPQDWTQVEAAMNAAAAVTPPTLAEVNAISIIQPAATPAPAPSQPASSAPAANS